MSNLCPICGEGILTEHTEKEVLHQNFQTAEVDSKYSMCNSCGSEILSTEQASKNKAAMLDVRCSTIKGFNSWEEVGEWYQQVMSQREGD